MKNILIFISFNFAYGVISPVSADGNTKVSPDSLISLADHYLDNHEIVQAISLLRAILLESGANIDSAALRKAHSNLGYAYYNLPKYDSSSIHYKKALDLDIALKDSMRMLRSYKNLGMAYQRQGLLGLAVETYNDGVLLAKALHDFSTLSDIYNSIGLVYHSAGDIEAAFSHHFLSLKGWQELTDSTGMSFSYNNIARCHHDLENYDSSLYYNFKALEIKKKSHSKVPTASTINNIGTAYLKLDSLELAESYLMEAYSIYKKLDNRPSLIASYNNLTDLAVRRGQYLLARAYLDSGAVILDHINDKELLSDHLELQVALAEKTGRHAEALAYHKELSILKEEIFQEEKLKVQEVESSYLLREKELERANAAQEAAFVRAENQRYLQLILILAASVLVTGSLLYFLLRLNKMLKVKNNIIQSQKEDLKHRTFNVLMRVQSLIRMASDNLTDENSKQVLANSEAAILSAASLQQHLSQDGENSHILLGNYLEDLVGRLEEVFHLTGHPISYKVEICEESSLPTNTVLNVGIIVAELVTNASKHAFNQEIAQPEITVRLEKDGKNLLISVRDNGLGLPQIEKQGIGTGLVKKLTGYIKAEMSVRSEGGTSYTLKLPT